MSVAYTAHGQSEGILLNANESSFAPDQQIMDEFFRLLGEVSLNRYPEDEAKALRQAFADVYNLPVAQVIAGNGSDALLQLMITTYCRDGKKLIMLDPDFGMYRFYSGCMQAQTKAYPTAWDGSFDLDDFARFALEHNAGLVLLSNPNNPTGHLLSRQAIRKLARLLGEDIVLASDEAYMNFDDESMLGQPLPDNVIVTATLSKAWGAAGMRCGFLYASPKRIAELLPWKIVYSISTLDQIGARAVLAFPEKMKDNVAMVRRERERIEKALETLDAFEHGYFHANFYQIRPLAPLDNVSVLGAFAKAGIAIRNYPDGSRIRITIGAPEENDQVLAVLSDLQKRVQAQNEGDSPLNTHDEGKGDEHA